MRYLLCAFVLTVIISSCKKHNTRSSDLNAVLVKKCESYMGTPYKFGGITTEGLDCSGLIYVAFKEMGVDIPRISYKQAEYFSEVSKNDLKIGDLIYFKVNSSRINHTGIVSRIIARNEIYFIHASTKTGVREDNLFSSYWINKFVKVTRPQI